MNQLKLSPYQRNIAHEIASGLQEIKEQELIEQVVGFLGEKKAIDFYRQVLEIEGADGMLTARADRRAPQGEYSSH